MLSDVHLGKISHFRKFGAAVPQQAILKNFETMDVAIDYFKPKRLVFMGDLFHSSVNKEWELFEDWVRQQSLSMTLVAGNHDIISPIKYEDLGIKVVSEMILDSFLLTHHPEEREGLFNFCGHIHPAVRLTGLGRQSVRLRCFYKSSLQMILPAMGEFTGSHTMAVTKECEVFAILGDAVLPVHVHGSKG
jgi:DNA ligase-associated metallophosphoesterase